MANQPDTEALYEVVGGQIVERKPSALQLRLAAVMGYRLELFARETAIGRAVAEMLFVLDAAQGLNRRPNAAFVSFERWPRDRRLPETEAWDVVPNLAVEVVGPTSDFDEVLQKVSEHLEAGVELVWVVIPSRKQVYVYRSETDVRVLPLSDQIDGGNILPQFRFSVAELFEEMETPESAK